ncbi:MAG: hypothetical protein KGN84_17045, partial [Acidobacteriota bacterium]|nr:hypothetical protein [Acidobacteriota bacterium]
MYGLGVAEIALIALVALLLVFGHRLRDAARAAGPRLPMFLLGGLETLGWYFGTGGSAAVVTWEMWPVFVRGGIEWVVLFEIVYRTRHRLRPGTTPVYIAVAWVLTRFLSPALLMLPGIGVSGAARSLLRSFYAVPSNWLPRLDSYPDNVESIGSAALFVLVSYLVIHRSTPHNAVRTGGGSWGGFKEAEMSPSKSQTTRLLCASAFLAGSGYREQVLSYLENESHGVSPELGVDMELVARVCQHARKWAGRLDVRLFLTLAGCGLVAAFIPPVGLALFVIASAGVYFHHSYLQKNRLVGNFRRGEFEQFDPAAFAKTDLDAGAHSALPRA